MEPKKMWREILDASGLYDLALERHSHDLLDGIGDPNEKLDATFAALCRRHEVKGWVDVGPVLDLMRTVDGFEGLRLPDHVVESVADRMEEAEGGKVIGVCTNTSQRRGTYSSTWGTPPWILEIVRSVFNGSITLDLASSEEHNKTIQAKRFYSERDPCPEKPAAWEKDVVWTNSPGPAWQVKEFWARWLWCVRQGARGGFLVFAGDHLRQLSAPFRPMPVIALRKRVRFVGAKGSANFPSFLVLSDGAPTNEFGSIFRWES